MKEGATMKGIIYSDNYCDYNDDYLMYVRERIADIEECEVGEVDEHEVYEYWLDEVGLMADEFEATLRYINKRICGDIVAVGGLGLWNGRVQGYRVFRNFNEIVRCCEDYNTFEIDRYNNLNLKAIHHDGTNYVVFRELKSDLSDVQIDNFLDKIYCGKATKRDLTRYTKSVGHYFDEYYGA